VIGQFSGQSALQHRFDHLGQKPTLTGQLQLARIDLGQHVIENTRGLQRLHGVSPRHRLVSVHIHRYCSISLGATQLHKPSDTPESYGSVGYIVGAVGSILDVALFRSCTAPKGFGYIKRR
jgi:hypothetical protein